MDKAGQIRIKDIRKQLDVYKAMDEAGFVDWVGYEQWWDERHFNDKQLELDI